MDRYYGSEERELHQSSSSPSPSPSPSSSSPPAAAADAGEEREYMFEKVVTPSDVGKLNRLVIPKQYAERYFPLDRRAPNEEAGRVLSFEEDPAGRTWRFRYSYWNSSQSYVMTKGWSRFVKDKRLTAGDTVTFSRTAASAARRLFIDWCYRPPPPDPPHLLRSSVPWGWGGRLFVPPPPPPPPSSASTNSAPAVYCRSVPPLLRMGGRTLDSSPLRVAEPKRVRLFGVNLDCSEQKYDDRRQQRESTSRHLPPPSPLQWRLSPTPAPASRGELPTTDQ